MDGFKISKTAPSAVFCSISLCFIKLKGVFIDASPRWFYLPVEAVYSVSSLHFVNASEKHSWMLSMKNGLL